MSKLPNTLNHPAECRTSMTIMNTQLLLLKLRFDNQLDYPFQYPDNGLSEKGEKCDPPRCWDPPSGPPSYAGKLYPSLPIQGHSAWPPRNPQEVCQPQHHDNLQSSKVLREDLMHPRSLATVEFFDLLCVLSLNDDPIRPRAPRLLFLRKRLVSQN